MEAISYTSPPRLHRGVLLVTARVRVVTLVIAVAGLVGCGVIDSNGANASPEGFAPGTWASSDSNVIVEIRSDGTGQFVNLPWWSGSAFDCSLEGAMPVSDTFIWNYSEELDMVLLAADNTALATTFEAGGAGGDDWSVLLYFVCMPDLPGWVNLYREE